MRFNGARRTAHLNLKGAGAAALNDDAEYDDGEHSGGDTNDGDGIHGISPFPQRCMSRKDAWCDVAGVRDFNSGLRISCASTAPEEPRRST
jgi:hypothetical protein